MLIPQELQLSHNLASLYKEKVSPLPFYQRIYNKVTSGQRNNLRDFIFKHII